MIKRASIVQLVKSGNMVAQGRSSMQAYYIFCLNTIAINLIPWSNLDIK